MDFLLDEKFLIPLLSTLGASLTIITGQQICNFSSRQRKKLYCMNYISDVADRLLFANLLIKEKTVLPHIEATKRIIDGDSTLLDTMFKADEFDILNTKNIEFNHLPEDYKLLVGYDSMKTLQAIELIKSLSSDDSSRKNLNNFVKENFKSELKFNAKTDKEKSDLLNTYWDYLDQIDRHSDRVNGFIANMLSPIIQQYINKTGFDFFSTKDISNNLNKIQKLKDTNKDLIPSLEKMKNNINGGIQKAL